MSGLLPLFPLQIVALPGATVPLHIFEDRYREMVGEAEARGTEFGIVRTIVRGEQSGIANAGCTVTVESVVNRYPDGRFDVMTRGHRRFRILSLDEEKAYLRGAVEFFADEEFAQAPKELLDRAFEAYEQLRRELGGSEGTEAPEATLNDLSFRLAEGIDDLDFRSVMLQSLSEPERLRLFAKFASDYIPRKQYVAYMQKKAPTNGSGHNRPGV